MARVCLQRSSQLSPDQAIKSSLEVGPTIGNGGWFTTKTVRANYITDRRELVTVAAFGVAPRETEIHRIFSEGCDIFLAWEFRSRASLDGVSAKTPVCG
jgi:hypothetical protein